MQNKLPELFDKHKICVICEGNEEYEYLERLKALKAWDAQYEIISDNAGGNGNIPARYQDRYQNGSYELVLVYCDTEKKPYEQYEDIKRKINECHGVETAADEVIMFGNPCTMHIIAKHWTETLIKTPAKPVNAPLIEEFTVFPITKEGRTRLKQSWSILRQRIMPICASECAIWKCRIRLQEVVISEGLWNYLKAVMRSGLIELMMCWRDKNESRIRI